MEPQESNGTPNGSEASPATVTEPVIHFPSLTLPEPETTPIMVKKGFGATFYEARQAADKAS